MKRDDDSIGREGGRQRMTLRRGVSKSGGRHFLSADPDSRHQSNALSPDKTRSVSCEPKEYEKHKNMGKQIDDNTIERLRFAMKAACVNQTPAQLFAKYDADKSGELSTSEVLTMIRRRMRIPAHVISNKDIATIVKIIDLDETGSLTMSELAAFVEDGLADDTESTRQKRHSSSKWGARPESMAYASKRQKRKAPTTFDNKTIERLRLRLQEALRGEDAKNAFRRFDTNKDNQLSPKELRLFIRIHLRIPPNRIPDTDITKFLKVIDVDANGSLTFDELTDFAERGLAAFHNASSLGKKFRLPSVSGLDAESLGRIIGTIRARLGNRTIRAAVGALVPGHFVGLDQFSELAKTTLFRLNDIQDSTIFALPNDLELLCNILKKPGDALDVTELAALVKRGANVVNGLENEAQATETIAQEVQRRLQRTEFQAKIKRIEDERKAALDRAEKFKKPSPESPIRPRYSDTLFSWFDNYNEQLKSTPFKEATTLTALIKLRDAMRLYEDTGEKLAVAATISKIGTIIAERPTNPYHRDGSRRAKELECAGRAFLAAEEIFAKELGNNHNACRIHARRAAETLIAAHDILEDIITISAVGQSVPGCDLLDTAHRKLTYLLGNSFEGLRPSKICTAAIDLTNLAIIEAKRMNPHFADHFNAIFKVLCQYLTEEERETKSVALITAKAHQHFGVALGKVLDTPVCLNGDEDASERQKVRHEQFLLSIEHFRKAESLYGQYLGPDCEKCTLMKRYITRRLLYEGERC